MRRSHPGRIFLTAAGAFFMLAAPAAVAAQVAVTPGQTVTGSLSVEDSKLAEGHGYDVYTFQGMAGQMIVATLRSPTFDTYLALARNTGVITEELATNDDGAGSGTDSRIAYSVPTDGTYMLIARGLSPDAAGDYTLELTTVEHVAPTIRPISVGETRVGELGAGDDFTDDLAYYEVFTFNGSAGERYGVTMRASQFDTYLVAGGWDGQTLSSISSNDDGFSDGTTDSRLTITLPADGQYAIRATSLGAQQSGTYTIALETLAPLAEATSTPIRAGETLIGDLSDTDIVLDDGSYFDLYEYVGAPGERVTVTMASDAFDTYLTAGDPAGGYTELGSNDDGGSDGTNSELAVQVPTGGRLLIRANSLGSGQTGTYTISVQGAGAM